MPATTDTKVASDGRHVAWPGVLLVAVYLVALLGLAFYTILALWPGVCGVSEPAGAAAAPRTLAYLLWEIPRNGEVSLILLVFAAAVLGGLIHAVRSFYWYIGNDLLFTRWVAMYLLLPIVSGSLGVVFYIVIRGGFYTPTVAEGSINPIGFAALGGLVGLFSEQAILKLKTIAGSFFEPGDKGGDDAGEELKRRAEEKAKRDASAPPPDGTVDG